MLLLARPTRASGSSGSTWRSGGRTIFWGRLFKLFLVLVRVGGVVIFGKAYLYNVGVIDTIHGNLHLAGAAFVEKEPLGHVGRRHHRRKRRRLHLVGVGEYLLRVQLRRLLRLGRRRDRRLRERPDKYLIYIYRFDGVDG